MRRALIVLAIMLLLAGLPSVSGRAAVPSRNEGGGTIGGLSVLANTSAEKTASLAELPTIIEVYTATWCTNCVKSEHALDAELRAEDVAIHVHRHEQPGGEDPFGTAEGDARWTDRYGNVSINEARISRAPPTVVINGELMHAGSLPDEGATLGEEYNRSLATQTTHAASGSSYLNWTLSGNRSGEVVWSFNYTAGIINSVRSWLVIVEDAAEFPEGGNDLGTYPHVSRSWIDLGTGNGGMISLELPQATDGEDLRLILIHDWDSTMGQITTCTSGDTKESGDGCNSCTCSGGEWSCTEMACEEGGFLPSLGALPIFAIIFLASQHHVQRLRHQEKCQGRAISRSYHEDTD